MESSFSRNKEASLMVCSKIVLQRSLEGATLGDVTVQNAGHLEKGTLRSTRGSRKKANTGGKKANKGYARHKTGKGTFFFL